MTESTALAQIIELSDRLAALCHNERTSAFRPIQIPCSQLDIPSVAHIGAGLDVVARRKLTAATSKALSTFHKQCENSIDQMRTTVPSIDGSSLSDAAFCDRFLSAYKRHYTHSCERIVQTAETFARTSLGRNSSDPSLENRTGIFNAVRGSRDSPVC